MTRLFYVAWARYVDAVWTVQDFATRVRKGRA